MFLHSYTGLENEFNNIDNRQAQIYFYQEYAPSSKWESTKNNL
jgi:hypothetical protein